MIEPHPSIVRALFVIVGVAALGLPAMGSAQSDLSDARGDGEPASADIVAASYEFMSGSIEIEVALADTVNTTYAYYCLLELLTTSGGHPSYTFRLIGNGFSGDYRLGSSSAEELNVSDSEHVEETILFSMARMDSTSPPRATLSCWSGGGEREDSSSWTFSLPIPSPTPNPSPTARAGPASKPNGLLPSAALGWSLALVAACAACLRRR